MSEFIHTKSKNISFSHGGADGYAYKLWSKNIEIDYIDSKTGHDGSVISDTLSHFYYILEGEGEFILDNKSYLVKTGDLVEVPPNHSLDYKGKMKMLLIMEPPYDPAEMQEVN